MSELDWKPEKNSIVPLHQQIYDFMKNKIMNGEWTIGTKIPPQRNLAKRSSESQYHCNCT